MKIAAELIRSYSTFLSRLAPLLRFPLSINRHCHHFSMLIIIVYCHDYHQGWYYFIDTLCHKSKENGNNCAHKNMFHRI